MKISIKEAITEIKESGLYGNQVHQETLELELVALEKQIPKEPIILLKDEDGYAYQFEHYLCPDCKNIFEQRPQGSKTPLYTPKYCPNCGAKMEGKP